MRAIRYGVCIFKSGSFLSISRNPLCVQLDMETGGNATATGGNSSQSAMRAIRYGAADFPEDAMTPDLSQSAMRAIRYGVSNN